MAMVTAAAFVGGFAAGWVARSLSGAPRNEMVGGVAKAFHAADVVRRWTSERAEWIEDLVAEGRAQYAATLRRAHAERREQGATRLSQEVSAP